MKTTSIIAALTLAGIASAVPTHVRRSNPSSSGNSSPLPNVGSGSLPYGFPRPPTSQNLGGNDAQSAGRAPSSISSRPGTGASSQPSYSTRPSTVSTQSSVQEIQGGAPPPPPPGGAGNTQSRWSSSSSSGAGDPQSRWSSSTSSGGSAGEGPSRRPGGPSPPSSGPATPRGATFLNSPGGSSPGQPSPQGGRQGTSWYSSSSGSSGGTSGRSRGSRT